MRKLLNRKGFSLVELMIVVVIMGILIAVAIPLYGAIQDRARANTCRGNQREVRALFAEYIMTDANKSADTFFKTTEKSFNGATQKPEDVFAPEFLASFEDGTLPECPEQGHHYRITKVNETTIKVECIADGTVDEDHELEQ